MHTSDEFWGADLTNAHDQAFSWVWHGYIAHGFTTLLTAQWKSGKTTLLSLLLSRLKQGGALAGLPVAATPALVVSEEPRMFWRPRHLRTGLDHIYFKCQPFKTKPTLQQWLDFLDTLDQLRQQHGFRLIAFDTLASLLPAGCESNGDLLLQAILPLQRFTSEGVANLLLHHPRKGTVQPGQAARGSGALPGFADIIVEMRTANKPGRQPLSAISPSFLCPEPDPIPQPDAAPAPLSPRFGGRGAGGEGGSSAASPDAQPNTEPNPEPDAQTAPLSPRCGGRGVGGEGGGSAEEPDPAPVDNERKPEHHPSSERRRRLIAFSRSEETPRELIIELNSEGTDYLNLGESEPDDFAANFEVLRLVLEDAEEKLTRADIRNAWPHDFPRPADRTLCVWLRRAVDVGRIEQDGTGRRMDPFRYWLPYVPQVWRESDPEGYDIRESLDQPTKDFLNEKEGRLRKLRTETPAPPPIQPEG